MIFSASTLLLATLVFNAASVMGAPVRMDTVESVARSEISTPVQPVARAAIVDVQDNRRRSQLGTVSRRSARIMSERDVPSSDFVEVREPTEAPAPAVEARTMRYPRRVYHDFYLKKREPATSVKETLTWKKVTVHDTPADAAAFHHGSAKVDSTVSIPIPTDLPSVTSTIISVSTVIPDVAATSPTADSTATEQATSAAPTETASLAATDAPTPAVSDVPAGASTDASPTPTVEPTAEPTSAPASEPTSAPADNGASAPASDANTATTDAPVASPTAVTSEAPAATSTDSSAATATATETPSTDSAAPTATATDSAAPTATATDSAAPTATATDSSAATATATDSAAPTATTTDGASAAESTATSTEGSSATTCAAPTSTDGASCPPPAATTTAAAGDASATDVPAEERRWVKAASSQPVARRSLAVSGASWASAVRRQLNN